ncbi:MAG: hypothetical protein VX280_02345 [Bacteroidota bacterium]|jgi:hypothetical protein|nr:hypothetical protein [Bacteroidota bacterium]|tara:strand:+ start:763 stop:1128 length:366 start_codon:yes stop_codon:yes gene_type:complete
MKKIKILSFTIGMFLSANVFSQHVLVNEVDINNEDIQFCELRVTARLLNPTKVKVYVDYGQKWSMKRQNIMTEDKKVVSFNSSVDALNFMDKNGWDYVEQTVTTSSDGETTYKYLMRRVEQ